MTDRKIHNIRIIPAMYIVLFKKRHDLSTAEIQFFPFLRLLVIKDPEGPKFFVCKLYDSHSIGSNNVAGVDTGHVLIQVLSGVIRAIMFQKSGEIAGMGYIIQ